jgi:hypothetical protein
MYMEIWKTIPGYEGRYEVSNLGNVRSLNYLGHIGKIQNLKPRLHHEGYLMVGLSLNKKRKHFGVHVLVAMAFLGHVPDGHNLLVDHRKEGNKIDNRPENLQITTNRINTTKAMVKDLPIGVYFSKPSKKYMARITMNGKQVYLGLFQTPEEASQAYQNKLKEINNA